MNVWSKNEALPGLLQAAQAANTSGSRGELLQKTLRALALDAGADRIGVWLEPPGFETQDQPVNFYGMAWDRDGAETTLEWRQLTLQPPLPVELLNAVGSVEQRFDHGGLPLIGPLLEMRRALWVPVARKARLRGILLAGSRSKNGLLGRPLFEAVAAQLAFVLELEEEQHRSRQLQADAQFARQMLRRIAGGQPVDTLLNELMEECCFSAACGTRGLRAVFAAASVSGRGEAKNSVANLEFRWKSGDPSWTNALESNVVAKVWRTALAGRQVLQEETELRSKHDRPVQLTAIPLEVGGLAAGIFLVGMAPSRRSDALLERLQLRASLAAHALDCWKREQAEKRESVRRRVQLDHGSQPMILLDEDGYVAALSAAAQALTGASIHGDGSHGRQNAPAGEKLALRRSPGAGDTLEATRPRERLRLGQLFQPADEQRVDRWFRAVSSSSDEPRTEPQSGPTDLPEGLLHNGVKVQLRQVFTVGGPYAAVALQVASENPLAPKASAAERELHSLIEWLDEGIVLYDTRDDVRALNSRFLQMTGLENSLPEELKTLDALIFKMSERVVDPGNFAQRWRNLARGIDGGVREELEFARPYPRIVQRIGRPVLDGEGRKIGRVEIYRDLSARREYQSTLLRTEKLAALGQLLSGVAHELNNPLTTILGYSQRLLQQERASGNGHDRQLRQIFEEAQRATNILRQLLRNVHESKRELAATSLNQVILQTMELQQGALAQENVRVELNLDPSNPLVYADVGQLQQVLLNLAGNARQALEQAGQGGTIRIRTKQIGEQRVLMEIADNGPGIPREIIGRIFDPFFTTKPAGTGTGLGLAIVSGIVREHGGHINVASPPGGGAIFSIALRAVGASSRVEHFQKMNAAVGISAGHPFPRSAVHVPTFVGNVAMLRSSFGGLLNAPGTVAPFEPASPIPLAEANLREAARRGSNRVLVVEDEPTVARLIADVLEDEGFSVDVLLDGHEALRQVARQSYDLAICDMKMPGIDGQQFYKTLMQSGNSLSERFLFVTGDVVSAPTHNFMEIHGVPHVAKPFRMEELKEKVYLVLQKFPLGRSTAAEAHNRG
jgi:signal transduction histidine kinase/AmiR/NasT family two-component response regulator